jgi:uncharacterized protein YbaP (TraB family)
MERILTEKHLEQIANCGAFAYSPDRTAAVIGWEEQEVKAMMIGNAQFQKAYSSGKYRAEYVIDLKLFEQAQAGDIKSLDKLESRKRARK